MFLGDNTNGINLKAVEGRGTTTSRRAGARCETPCDTGNEDGSDDSMDSLDSTDCAMFVPWFKFTRLASTIETIIADNCSESFVSVMSLIIEGEELLPCRY